MLKKTKEIHSSLKKILIILFFVVILGMIPDPHIVAQTLEIGKKAPDFVGVDLSNKKISLSQFKGKVVIINFWATWCMPCRRELPFFSDLYKEYNKKGLVILGINLDRQRARAKNFLKTYPLPFPVVFDSKQQIVPIYKPRTIPASYLLDRKGIINHVHLGYRFKDQAIWREKIKKVLSKYKKPTSKKKK